MAVLNPRILADAVLVLHAAYIVFVVGGLMVILLGGWLGWRWVRNPWFRVIHLAAIGWVVGQAWLGIDCPLTTLEIHWRERAGGEVYPVSFVAYWVRRLCFFQAPPWVFTTAYTAFGGLVLGGWLWVRPRGFGARLPG